MSPIQQRRDAAIERNEPPPQAHRINVLRPEIRAELDEHLDKHAREIPTASRVPKRRLPKMAVAIDEARQDEIIGRFHDLAVGGGNMGSDLHDLAIVNEAP